MHSNVPMEHLSPCLQLDIHGVYTFYRELHYTLSISKLIEIRACPEHLMLLLPLQFCDLKSLINALSCAAYSADTGLNLCVAIK